MAQEDGVPSTNQFLLNALSSKCISPPGKPSPSGERGLQPKKLTVPKDGDVLILGRGSNGISDPYMSGRQACLSVVVDSGSGVASLKLQALGRNPCLYRTAATASGEWETLAGVGTKNKKKADAEGAGGVHIFRCSEIYLRAAVAGTQCVLTHRWSGASTDPAGSSVLLQGGDEICLLADQTMRYQVVHVLGRALTRSLSSASASSC